MVKRAEGAESELSEAQAIHIINCLIAIRAFPIHSFRYSDAECTWLREGGQILSRNSWTRPDIRLVLEEIDRPFRARAASLVKELMDSRLLVDTTRDLICAVADTRKSAIFFPHAATLNTPHQAFGRKTVAGIAKESELVKALKAVQSDAAWSYREERITDLLIILGAFPSLSAGTERYLERNLAKLLPLVEPRPGVQIAIEQIVRPFCKKSPDIVDALLQRGLSTSERGVLDTLLLTGTPIHL